MVEYNDSFLSSYKTLRPNSYHIINDATKVDYAEFFQTNSVPQSIDYLQIDLEANNGSTLQVLQLFDTTIFNNYKFATVTFEHDIYHTNFANTREESRKIFDKRGYIRVFADIHNIEPQYVYEDWYVHPDLIDMEYVKHLMTTNSKNYVNNSITGTSINWQDIQY
jgi:hypothetical protein